MMAEDPTSPVLIHCAEYLEFAGAYRRALWRTVLYHILGISSLGLLYLLVRWRREIRTALRFESASPNQADLVILQERNSSYEEVDIEVKAVPSKGMAPGLSSQVKLFKFIMYKSQQYYLEKDTFEPVQFDLPFIYPEIHEKMQGGIQSQMDLSARRIFHGYNEMPLDEPSVFSIIIEDVLRPFFVFQICCVLLWVFDAYGIYATVILLMMGTNLRSTVYEKKETFRHLRELVTFETFVNVFRFKETEKIKVRARDLVPGDIVEVESGSQFSCDCILMQGNCIVSESLLTGQSVPVLKSALPRSGEEFYSEEKDRKHTLFCGTSVLSVRGAPRALVVATGFASMKGRVLRTMLYRNENRFKFYGDAVKFIWIFCGICAIATSIAILSFLHMTATVRDILFRSLDLISIGIPPALPLTMTLGVALALRRLRDKNVNCLSPMGVVAAGKVEVVCFDKTGTLTEDVMQFAGIWGGGMRVPVQSIPSSLALCLACCNSITLHDGVPLGAAEDRCLYPLLHYEIKEEEERRVLAEGRDMKMERMFHFSSQTKRMGVVARHNTGELVLYLKGAPEELRPLLQSMPKDYPDFVSQFTGAGLRVLACAYKQLPPDTDLSLPLKSLESKVHFLGLVLLKNNIKPEAFSIVHTLAEADYRMLISTGDNILTGVSVAEELKIIPSDYDVYLGEIRKSERSVAWVKIRGEGNSAYDSVTGRVEWFDRIQRGDTKFALAVSGKAFDWLLKSYKSVNERLLRFVLGQIYVCGRMSPIHKLVLIEELKRLGLIVAMVGDGANDSGSIKAADVGLCVSQMESSLAAPFTGPSVLCLEDVLKEGKATLAASFQCFKFMGLYSMVQLMSVLTLYTLKTNFSTREFLYVDLFTVIPLTFVMGVTKAYPVLTKNQPPGSILSLSVVMSISGQILIQLSFICLTYLALTVQDWYLPQGTGLNNPFPVTENTVIFLVSNFQYLAACLVYSIGPPFRVPLYTNGWFAATVAVLFVLNSYLLVAPHSQVLDFLGVNSI